MTAVTRRPLPFVLSILALVGLFLVITGSDAGPALQRVITSDGVEVDIPDGWEPLDERPFEFRPASGTSADSWLVAWACGPGGCIHRSLVEWVQFGEGLPTLVGARADEGELLFDLEESSDDSSRVLKARNAAGGVQVFVAVFHDGSDHYVECGLSMFDDVDRLGDEIVAACRGAVPPTP